MNWLSIGVFVIQTLLELTSNLFSNLVLGALSPDTFLDPLDILLSGVLAFWRR